jgi:hypothetical protein
MHRSGSDTNVSLAKKPELGEAIVSVRPEAQYLEFSFAASVQGWRTKWHKFFLFYLAFKL